MHKHDHSHGHHHHHHHAPSAADAARSSFIIGIVLNLLYVVAEAVVGIVHNSMALLSDAGHNLGDVASLALSLLAFRLAKVKPNETFTYGYKKTTILASLTNAVILLIAIGTLGYESILRLSHPVPVQGDVIAWVAGLGIVVNGVSAFLFFRNKEHDLNTKGAYLHLLADAVVSAVVVLAGMTIHWTNLYWLDPVVSIIVLVVILFSTWSLLTDSLKLSLDAVPVGIDIEEIKKLIGNNPNVLDVHHMHIWAMSTTENALTTHLVLREPLTFEQKMEVVHHIKHDLEHHNIQHATVELESEEKPCHEGGDC